MFRHWRTESTSQWSLKKKTKRKKTYDIHASLLPGFSRSQQKKFSWVQRQSLEFWQLELMGHSTKEKQATQVKRELRRCAEGLM